MDLPTDEQVNRWLADDTRTVKDFNDSRVGKALKAMTETKQVDEETKIINESTKKENIEVSSDV